MKEKMKSVCDELEKAVKTKNLKFYMRDYRKRKKENLYIRPYKKRNNNDIETKEKGYYLNKFVRNDCSVQQTMKDDDNNKVNQNNNSSDADCCKYKEQRISLIDD